MVLVLVSASIPTLLEFLKIEKKKHKTELAQYSNLNDILNQTLEPLITKDIDLYTAGTPALKKITLEQKKEIIEDNVLEVFLFLKGYRWIKPETSFKTLQFTVGESNKLGEPNQIKKDWLDENLERDVYRSGDTIQALIWEKDKKQTFAIFGTSFSSVVGIIFGWHGGMLKAEKKKLKFSFSFSVERYCKNPTNIASNNPITNNSQPAINPKSQNPAVPPGQSSFLKNLFVGLGLTLVACSIYYIIDCYLIDLK